MGVVLLVSALGALPLKALAAPPDTVLATVGPSAITAAEFRHAWQETHPDRSHERLTPQAVRGFLEVLVDRALIRAAAARNPSPWTAADSAAFAADEDRMVLGGALRQLLAGTRAAARDTAMDEGALGVLAREQVMAVLAPVYDEPLLARIARSFRGLPRPAPNASLAAQLRMLSALPVFDPTDRDATLARTTGAGAYTVRDLERQWAGLSPAYRPRVVAAEQVRDLVANGLFERWLRRTAREQHAAQAPAVLAELEREREAIAIDHLMAREIHERIVPDTAAVERWFLSRATRWTLPKRYLVTRLVIGDRRAALGMSNTLRDAAAAESLVARAQRRGVRYRGEISALTDSADFERARRTRVGAVTGPDSTADGWAVLRVDAVLPARRRTWAEARDDAMGAWYAERSAERLEALLARERRTTRIRRPPLPAALSAGLTEP